MTRIVVDPVTRVGGHLRVEAEIERGVVTEAWVAGTAYRGIEGLLVGRDPRDAWLLAERTCGVSVGAHGLAAARAVEDALGIVVPTNARIVRNLLAGTSLLIDHVTGLYERMAPDWVDLTGALGADLGEAAAVAAASGTGGFALGPEELRLARDRIALLARDPAGGPFAGLPAHHPASALGPVESLLVLVHRLQALDWARRLGTLETILGGKSPHPQTFLVGGMAVVPPWAGATGAAGGHPDQVERNRPEAVAASGLAAISRLLQEARAFVDEVLLPDVIRLARAYPSWNTIGAPDLQLLSFGEFPLAAGPDAPRLLPAGRSRAGTRSASPVDPERIVESVGRSWYDPESGDRRPAELVTRPRWDGRETPLRPVAGEDRYSWSKAPRYDGAPMETGPLARVTVGLAQGAREVRSVAEGLLATLDADGSLLEGTLGRILARTIEAEVLATRLPGWLGELRESMAGGDLALADVTRWRPASWPDRATGIALGESARGALGHWVAIEGGRVAGWSIVDGSTWNASPRDARGTPGTIEAALVGTPVADPARPLELLRVVRSFDPCLACGVH